MNKLISVQSVIPLAACYHAEQFCASSKAFPLCFNMFLWTLWSLSDSFMLIQCPGHASCQVASKMAVELLSLWRLIECVIVVPESGKVWLGASKRLPSWTVYRYRRNAADGGLGMSTWAQGNDKPSFKLRFTAHAMRLSPPGCSVHRRCGGTSLCSLCLWDMTAGPAINNVWWVSIASRQRKWSELNFFDMPHCHVVISGSYNSRHSGL